MSEAQIFKRNSTGHKLLCSSKCQVVSTFLNNKITFKKTKQPCIIKKL